MLMSRSLMPAAPSLRQLSRALLPQLIAQALLIAAVMAWPQITQWTRPAEGASATESTNTPEAERLMQEAIKAQQAAEPEAPLPSRY